MEAILARSIEAFDREEWNALFADELEDWHYYRAVENAAIAGFEWIYLAVWDDGRLRAAVPGFITEYRIDTTLGGPLKRVAGAVSRIAPRLLGVPLASLGSPVGEICHAGFAADCSVAERRRLLDVLLARLDELAAQRRIGMIAVKDASGADDALWAGACGAAGLRRMPGQATAVLDLPYRSLDEYLAALGAGNGALFQLVPLRWPLTTAVAGSMIGEIGALGGGLVANAMGLSKQYTGTYFWGFALVAGRSLAVLAMMRFMQVRWTRTWAEKGGRARSA